MRVHARQGDTVDALCWRHLGATRDVVEQALSLNPGLADVGPILPHGMAVELPEPPARARQVKTVRLWD